MAMDPMRYLSESQGFFSRSDAREAGYGDRDVQQMIRARVWHRFRRGYFTFTDLWLGMDEVQRHQVRSHAVLDSLGPGVALSHVSGAIEHGLAVWRMPLDRVHVTRLDGAAGRVEGDVVHHQGRTGPRQVIEVNDHPTMVPERCALEAASRVSGESALVMLDSLLFLERCDKDQLMRQFASMERWPFSRRLHVPTRMADAASQSPGESRGRWLFWTHHLPAPQLQFEVFDADGVLRGICDWGWPEHGLLGEFDGQVKYGKLLKPGQDASSVVYAEKQREDEIRELTSYAMFRIGWADFDVPAQTIRRIEKLMYRFSRKA
jgi:hypothetical protein